MKKLLMSLVIGFSSLCASEINPTIEKLIPALIQQESNGNNKAVGDNGKALGSLQIWKVVLSDVNRFYKTNYKHEDMFNREKSKEVCRYYLTYWGKQYTRKTGKKPNEEVLARIWNGGPSGYKMNGTIKYWKSVKNILQTIK